MPSGIPFLFRAACAKWRCEEMTGPPAERCTCCGVCVSVCPYGALELAETRLVIDEAQCNVCELCIQACPAGALTVEGEAPPLACVRKKYDLVVVGAGPAGSTAARFAAERDLDVLLLEKRQEIGSPARCAEGINREMLLPFLEPEERWISAHTRHRKRARRHRQR